MTTYQATCESGFSNILCATPTQPGQVVETGVVEPLETGKWVTEGKGKNATTTFVVTTGFVRGDDVIIRGTVLDETGAPVADATVNVTIGGPESSELASAPSDAAGAFEVTWRTSAPNKRGDGGTTPGSYSATVSGLTASGYSWNKVATTSDFVIDP